MSLVITDFVQVYSIFSEFGNFFNIGAFIAIIVLSLLKVMEKVYIEKNIFIALLLLLGLTVHVYPDSALGLVKSLAIVASVFLLILNIGLFNNKIYVDFFVNTLVFISLLKLVIFIITVNVSFFQLLSNPSETRFSYSFFFNPIYLARSCGLGVIAALFMNKNYVVKFFIISCLLLGMYISGSRGPILALLMITFIYVIQREGLSAIFKILVQLIFVMIFFIALSSNFIIRNNDGVESAFEDRFLLIFQAFELFKHNIIIGSGLGSFSSVSYLGHPHNIILELMAETGLLGTVIFMAVVIQGLKKVDNNFFWFSLVYILINSMFSGSISNNIGLILFSVFSTRYQVQRNQFV